METIGGSENVVQMPHDDSAPQFHDIKSSPFGGFTREVGTSIPWIYVCCEIACMTKPSDSALVLRNASASSASSHLLKVCSSKGGVDIRFTALTKPLMPLCLQAFISLASEELTPADRRASIVGWPPAVAGHLLTFGCPIQPSFGWVGVLFWSLKSPPKQKRLGWGTRFLISDSDLALVSRSP
jgi:hypothetical protein